MAGGCLAGCVEGGRTGKLYILFLAVLSFGIWACVYWVAGTIFKSHGLSTKKWAIRGLCIAIGALTVALCMRWRMTGLIVVYLTALFAIVELIALGTRHFWNNERAVKLRRVFRWAYRSCLIPILTLCLLLGYGYLNMRQIVKTEYTVVSDKLSDGYRIVLITDTHYGTIQDRAILQAAVQEIDALAPDIVLLGGDIVEEETSKEDMEEAFRVLGSLKSTYGIYYIYGNHDRQPYTSAPAYTDGELAEAITANEIVILNDRIVDIGQDLVLAGREDAGRRQGRLSSEELLKGADRSRFLIVADHQPLEAEENAAQGADLELSGHTHAGQLLPIGHINTLHGMRNYGLSQEGGCTVIVSSGAAGWGFPIRTQGRCEYVVISLRPDAP